MRKLYLRVWIFMLIALSANAADTISKSTFIGDKPSGLGSLYNRQGKIFMPDSLSADSLKITSYYKNQGWFDCTVGINYERKGSDIEITYQINKGEYYALHFDYNSIAVDSLSNNLRYYISLYDNSPASASNLESLSESIIDYYSDNGYPYCEVRFNDLRLDKPGMLSLSLDIQPGPQVIIDKIIFDGIKNLEASFLLKYIGLSIPSVYSQKNIEQAENRLTKASFIKEQNGHQLQYFKRPESGVVVFPIKETSTLILDGAAGYSSQDDDFYGKFNATINNILGRGRQFNLEWVKKDKYSRNLSVEYSEPYAFNLPFNLSLQFYQEDRDSLYIDNGGSVGLEYIASDIYTYGVAFKASQLNPETYGRTYLPQKNKLTLSVNFTADTRDYKANPRSGDYLYLNADFILATVKEDSLFAASQTSYRAADLKWEKYLALSNSSVVFAGVTASGNFSNDLTDDDLSPLGGFGSLRGYMQEQFYVSRWAMGTIEYRLLTSRRGRAYIFSDIAVFQKPDTDNESSITDYKAGFGIGITAEIKLGQATVEIAIPSDEGFANAKVHFGIETGI